MQRMWLSRFYSLESIICWKFLSLKATNYFTTHPLWDHSWKKSFWQLCFMLYFPSSHLKWFADINPISKILVLQLGWVRWVTKGLSICPEYASFGSKSPEDRSPASSWAGLVSVFFSSRNTPLTQTASSYIWYYPHFEHFALKLEGGIAKYFRTC